MTVPTKPIKLVALDLDGTLVREDLSISQRVKDTLSHLINETDIKVVIATGRMYRSAVSFAQEIGVTEPIVTYQGAMVRDLIGSEPIYHQAIPLDIAKTLLEYLHEGDYHTNIYMNDSLWTHQDNPHLEYYRQASRVEPELTTDLLSVLVAPPTKVMVIDDSRVESLMKTLQDKFAGHLVCCRSRHNFCEMIHQDVSKWNAIKHLTKQYGIQADEVIAIGDQNNDLSMIQEAGIGVAMGQAPDDVKIHANWVTKSVDEDGAAVAIEKFVLN